MAYSYFLFFIMLFDFNKKIRKQLFFFCKIESFGIEIMLCFLCEKIGKTCIMLNISSSI